jgi:hypothetical protein
VTPRFLLLSIMLHLTPSYTWVTFTHRYYLPWRKIWISYHYMWTESSLKCYDNRAWKRPLVVCKGYRHAINLRDRQYRRPILKVLGHWLYYLLIGSAMALKNRFETLFVFVLSWTGKRAVDIFPQGWTPVNNTIFFPTSRLVVFSDKRSEEANSLREGV